MQSRKKSRIDEKSFSRRQKGKTEAARANKTRRKRRKQKTERKRQGKHHGEKKRESRPGGDVQPARTAGGEKGAESETRGRPKQKEEIDRLWGEQGR